MSKKPKTLSSFPLGKLTPKGTEDYHAFLAWLRLNHKPRYTEATRFDLKRAPSPAYVFTAHNQAKIGFTTKTPTELCYLHPEAPASWFHIDINKSATKGWREGAVPESEFKFTRRYLFALPFRLAFWRLNLPGLLDYLGCASDLRLVTTLTVVLNYKPAEIISIQPGHYNTEQRTAIQSLLFPNDQ